MESLEQMAKVLFEQYSLRETGKKANWNYLNKERQADWMLEILMIHEHLANRLIDEVKPVIEPPGVNTSWANGYNAGIRSERIKYINLVNQLHGELLEELEVFKEKK